MIIGGRERSILFKTYNHGYHHQIGHYETISLQHELISQDIALDEGPCAPNPSSCRQGSYQDGSRSEPKATPDELGYRLKKTTDRQ